MHGETVKLMRCLLKLFDVKL